MKCRICAVNEAQDSNRRGRCASCMEKKRSELVRIVCERIITKLENIETEMDEEQSLIDPQQIIECFEMHAVRDADIYTIATMIVGGKRDCTIFESVEQERLIAEEKGN